jgi:hypothetical protein
MYTLRNQTENRKNYFLSFSLSVQEIVTMIITIYNEMKETRGITT